MSDYQLIPGDPDRWHLANDADASAESLDGAVGLSGSEVGTLLVHPPTSYRHAFGDKPIRLGAIEFQILLFLASRPYHAFTPKQICQAVAQELKILPLDQSTLNTHIDNLREHLGVLSDFVQTVPGVGWRYKA